MKSSTLAQFRSAWIPPAVAQAPMVTRVLALLADLADPLGVVRGRDRAFDQADVVGPGDLLRPGFEEVGDLDGLGHGQQLVLRIQQRELAAVARGKLEDGQFGLGHG